MNSPTTSIRKSESQPSNAGGLGLPSELASMARVVGLHYPKACCVMLEIALRPTYVCSLPRVSQDVPLLGIEPSALLSLVDEYPELVREPWRAQAKHLAEHSFDRLVFVREWEKWAYSSFPVRRLRTVDSTAWSLPSESACQFCGYDTSFANSCRIPSQGDSLGMLRHGWCVWV